MSLFDQSAIGGDINQTGATMLAGNQNMSNQRILLAKEPSESDSMLRNDFLNEMGMSSPDMLSAEEKKGLDTQKQDRQSSDLDTSMAAFAQ